MRYEIALKIFQHTVDLETRVNVAINLGLVKLTHQNVIETVSQAVVSALTRGERVWMTSDLHFLHTNIIGFSDRPFRNTADMNESLLHQLSKVRPGEILIFLGDMAIGNHEETVALIRRIPGRKILVAGNHDLSRDGMCRFSDEKNLFEAVVPFLFWTGQQGQELIMTHYPAVIPSSVKRLTRVLNYHGHLHQTTLPPTDTVKHMNVGWDVNHTLHCL